MMRLNGREVAAIGTLLDTCHAAGVDLPAFCHDPHLSTGGHCRACLVEQDDRLVAACRAPPLVRGARFSPRRSVCAPTAKTWESSCAPSPPRAAPSAKRCKSGAWTGSATRVFARIRAPHRLTTPLIRKDGVLTPASWDQAIALVAAEFQKRPGKVGGLSSSRARWDARAWGSTPCLAKTMSRVPPTWAASQISCPAMHPSPIRTRDALSRLSMHWSFWWCRSGSSRRRSSAPMSYFPLPASSKKTAPSPTRRGISDGARVQITSATGTAIALARITRRVAPGTVFLSFHFPSTATNAVIGDVCDRITGCPEYKVAAVEVSLRQ